LVRSDVTPLVQTCWAPPRRLIYKAMSFRHSVIRRLTDSLTTHIHACPFQNYNSDLTERLNNLTELVSITEVRAPLMTELECLALIRRTG